MGYLLLSVFHAETCILSVSKKRRGSFCLIERGFRHIKCCSDRIVLNKCKHEPFYQTPTMYPILAHLNLILVINSKRLSNFIKMLDTTWISCLVVNPITIYSYMVSSLIARRWVRPQTQ